MNALKEYTFVGSPLRRISDGKDLVRVELTFHKVLPTNKYKKRAESRRQPAPFAGEWPRQPAPARRPTTTSTPARRSTPCMEQEATPPTTQTLADTARDYRTYDRTQKTAIIDPSPVIKKPATPPTTPDSPPKKRSRVNSPPEPTRDLSEPPMEIYDDEFSQPFPLHKKYNFIDVYDPAFKEFEAVVVKAQRLPRPDETLNVDLPVFFMYHMADEDWYYIKGPTSKNYYEEYFTAIEKRIETCGTIENVFYWYNFLEEVCNEPDGTRHKFHRIAPPE